MERFVNVAGAQTGPIARDESRQRVVSRLLELMREAKSRGSDIVVFPELALTTFFPRWWMEDEAEIDNFFDREMPSPATRPLFASAKSLGIGFYLGYAELAQRNGVSHRYNTAILVDKNAEIVGKYRKVHLPGHADNRSHYPFQHLEKRAISSPAIWAFRYGGRSAPMSGCASATTAAGRKPIGSWECKVSS